MFYICDIWHLKNAFKPYAEQSSMSYLVNLSIGVLSGVFYLYNPCTISILPIYVTQIISIDSRNQNTKKSIYYLSIFSLGTSMAFISYIFLLRLSRVNLIGQIYNARLLLYSLMFTYGTYILIKQSKFCSAVVNNLQEKFYSKMVNDSRMLYWFRVKDNVINTMLKSNIRILIGIVLGLIAIPCNTPLYATFFYILSTNNLYSVSYMTLIIGFFLGINATILLHYALLFNFRRKIFKRHAVLFRVLQGLLLMIVPIIVFIKQVL